MNEKYKLFTFFPKYLLIILIIQSGIFNASMFCSTKNLKILVVVNYFPHPLQFFILNQITGLIDKGNDVWILANNKRKTGKVQDEIFTYGLLDKTKYDISQFDLDTFDIIYCQIGDLAIKFATIKSKLKSRWKLVSAFRGFDATNLIKKNPKIYSTLFNVCDLLLPVCNFFKDCLIQADCPKEKIKVHHSAIDCKQFIFKPRIKNMNTINIVTIARLYPLKGHKYAIRAVANLIKKNINISYTIVGDGWLKEKLSKLIENLGCKEKINIVGEKSHEEIVEILNKAHIFLLASHTTQDFITEGVPNALMEAMACELPVISTYHGGIPELVKDGVSGFLVPEKNILALTHKLEYLILHPELWPILGSAGKSQVLKKYNIEVNNEKLAYMLRELCT